MTLGIRIAFVVERREEPRQNVGRMRGVSATGIFEWGIDECGMVHYQQLRDAVCLKKSMTRPGSGPHIDRQTDFIVVKTHEQRYKLRVQII